MENERQTDHGVWFDNKRQGKREDSYDGEIQDPVTF